MAFQMFIKVKADLTVGTLVTETLLHQIPESLVSEGLNVGLLCPHRHPSSWQSVLALCVLSVSPLVTRTPLVSICSGVKAQSPLEKGWVLHPAKIYSLWFLELV